MPASQPPHPPVGPARSLAGGQHPHYRCQARELEQRAGGAGPGHGEAGCPPGCQGGAAGRGQCQSWQGQSGSHGSVMGATTHASRPVPAGPLSPCPFQLWAHPNGWCLPYHILNLHLPKPLFPASLSEHKVTRSVMLWNLGGPAVWSVPWSKGLDFYQVSRGDGTRRIQLSQAPVGVVCWAAPSYCSWCSQAQPGE